jgi:hypothetical protein
MTSGWVHSRVLAEHATTASLGDLGVRRGAEGHRKGSRRRCLPPSCQQVAVDATAGDGDAVGVHAPVRDHGSCFCCCGGRSVGLAQRLRDGKTHGAIGGDGVRLAQTEQRELEEQRGVAVDGVQRGAEGVRQNPRAGLQRQ